MRTPAKTRAWSWDSCSTVAGGEPRLNVGESSRLTPSEAAQRRLLSVPGEPLFVADWERALMIHYQVDPEELQRVVPFELDLHEGRAFVTLVAFTLRRM